MISLLGHPILIMPLQLTGLFAEPLVFIAGWILLGWFLLQTSHQAPANDDAPAVIEHHHDHEDDGLSGLQLALLIFSLYYLLRYWCNR